VNDRSYFWVDRRGAPVEVKNALGFVTRLYREDPLWPGEVTRVRYPNGREVTSTLDEAGRLSSTTDWATSAGGRFATTLYEWDARCGAVSRVTLPEGEVTSRGYDAQCRPEWVQSGLHAARRVTFGYKPLSDPAAPGLPASVSEPGVHTSTFGYDANGNLRFTATPGNDTTTFVNDALGRVRITRTPIRRAQNLFQTDSATYDVRDRVIRADSHGPRMEDADSQRVVVETDYDPEGLARAVWRYTRPDPMNIDTLVTRWKHDALGRVTAEIAADSTPATWDDNPRDTTAYNPAGLPVWTRTRRGDVLSSRYDAAGRPVWRHHTEAVHDSTSWGIPSRQRISSCIPATPVEHVYPWFPTNVVGCTLRIPADSSVFAYDEMGNLRRAANGAATVRRGYLANGLLAADTLEIRTLSGGASARAPYVLAYEYDLNGRRIGLAHPAAIAPVANAVTRYTYDPATGALASVTDPLGNLFSFRYDTRGHLDTLALPGGMRQAYDYDGSGRLSLYRASIPTVASGQLLSDVTFQYDERGKMLESSDAGLGKEVMSARYSGLGHLVRSVYSSSGTALSGATSVNQTTATMRYDPLGNGYHTLSSNANQLPDHRDRSLSNRENSSAYLPLTGRLRLNWDQTSTTEFSYDRAGNTVFEMTRFPGPNVNGRDRVSYYGGDGKLRVVDARTRTAADESATWEEYRYDALGRRVQVLSRAWCTGGRIECNHATVRRTVWDGDQALYEIRMVELEGDSDGTPSQQPIGLNMFNLNTSLGRVLLTHGLGIDQPLSAIRMEYGDYHTDGYRSWPTFSVVPLWNQRGQAPFITFGAGGSASVGMAFPGNRTFCPSSYADGRCLGTQWLLAWDAYGARKNGTIRNYNGAQVWLGSAMEDQQDASGLLYRRNRYYDPSTGRFTQEDPIGLAGGLNLYGFANGDPVSYSDPYGLRADSVVFTGAEARRLWGELRGHSETMMRSGDGGFAVLGGMLVGVLDAMESSSKTYVVSAIDYPDSFEQSTGGGNARCSGNLCTIRVDTKTRGRGAHLGPLTILAHEAGGAYLQAEAGVDHHGPTGAVMVENFARGIFGCSPRNGHGDSTTPCSH
jgi:RHS repeat-associated protein